MELSDAQKVAVTRWIQEGRSLADVQRSLREDFEISITYMDVRFLVDDLDIAVVEEEPEAPEVLKSRLEKTRQLNLLKLSWSTRAVTAQ
jgi:hypothetical protein